MKKVRSHKGRVVDFAALMSKHGNMIAAGNAKMNARGDLLGNGGVVVKTVDDMARAYHRNAAQAVVDYTSIKDIETEVLSASEAVAQIEQQMQAAKNPTKKRSTTQSED